MVPNQETNEDDQPVQIYSHAQQPLQPQTCVQEHCPGEKQKTILQVKKYIFKKWGREEKKEQDKWKIKLLWDYLILPSNSTV